MCFWAMLQNFPYYALIMLHCTQLCSIMLYKLLLPEFEDQSLSLTIPISKQLRVMNLQLAHKLALCLISDNYFFMELS